MEIDNSIAALMLMYMLFVFIICWVWESRRARKRAQEEADMRGDNGLTLEERAQRIVDLEDGLHLHETFWRAALYATSLIIAEYDTLIALCEKILPDVPKHPEELEKLIAKLKHRRNEYVKHREEEVTEIVREKLDEAGLEHIEIVEVEMQFEPEDE